MPRRTHYARLQKVEWRSGTCVCQRPLVLTCLKTIEAHGRGEAIAEPCPAGCAPETRKVVVLNLAAWRNGEGCACPTCDPPEQRRPAVPETVAEPALALPKPADASADADGLEAQPEAQRAPPPAAGLHAGRGEAPPDSRYAQELARLQAEYEAGNFAATYEVPASKAVVEAGRARVSVPVGAPPPKLGPEDVVGGPEPHGACAIPWCGHPLEAHHCYTRTLPCRHCGWPVGAHDGFEPGLPYASRRLWPCGTYLAINFDGGERDGCEMGCGCPGWRRTEPYITEREAAIQAVRAEQERLIARGKREIEETRAQIEEMERAILRAQGPNDLGTSPHGAPVFVEGERW